MASKTKRAKVGKPQAISFEKPQAPMIDLIMAARLARALGISAVTLWRWRRMAGFPAPRKIRQHVYFSQREVLTWIDGQQQAA
jgi:predicted DNA-binding transcriptional regulator AlpA